MMTMRRFIAFMATAGLIFALAGCGGGGSGKGNATKAPRATGTAGPSTTATGDQTPGLATASSESNGGSTTPGSGIEGRATAVTGEHLSYRVDFTLASDPGDLQPLIEDPHRFRPLLEVVIGDGVISLDGDDPFILVAGTIDANGAFIATGAGRIEPYPSVQVTLQGTIADDGRLTGTYVIGTNGAFPGGQVVTYRLTGKPADAPTPTPTP